LTSDGVKELAMHTNHHSPPIQEALWVLELEQRCLERIRGDLGGECQKNPPIR